MIDITPVPDGFKDAICQTEYQDILHRFFTEVVVDAENLFLAEDFPDLAVQFFGRGKVVAEWLFYNYTCPAFTVTIESCRAQILDNIRILTGWCGQVKDAVAVSTAFLIDLIQERVELFVACRFVKIGLQVMNTGRKAFPYLGIDGFLARVFID